MKVVIHMYELHSDIQCSNIQIRLASSWDNQVPKLFPILRFPFGLLTRALLILEANIKSHRHETRDFRNETWDMIKAELRSKNEETGSRRISLPRAEQDTLQGKGIKNLSISLRIFVENRNATLAFIPSDRSTLWILIDRLTHVLCQISSYLSLSTELHSFAVSTIR